MRAPDQEVRDRILAARSRSFVVEAGAGTGKTTLLIERVLELLRHGTPVTRLAVITFTRKAAAELVARLAGRLADARDEGLEWAARALADLELADVGTTDAFCRRILEAFPLQAEVPPGFGLADEISQVALREEAWARFVEHGGEDGAAWLARLRELGGKTAALRRLADALLESRDLAPAADPASGTPDLAAIFRENLSPVAALLPACDNPDDRLRRHVEELIRDGRISEALGGAAAERVLLAHRRGQAGRYTRRIGRKQDWGGRKDDVIAGLERLDEAMERAIAARSGGLAHELALRLAGYFAEYERLKRRRGLLDFRDLALRTRDLLVRRPDVRRLVASRWDAILLDEVQDTDPLQMEISFLLATDDPAVDPLESPIVPGKLFLVGDPKQSIYRFRRADIELYERAKGRLAGQGEAPDIVANFRSDPEIVDLVNRVFAGWMERPEDGAWQASYVPLVAARASAPAAESERGPAAAGQLELFAASVRTGSAAEPATRTSLLLPDLALDPRPADERRGPPPADLRADLERDACGRLVQRILGLDGAGPGWQVAGRAAVPEDIAVLVRRIAWGDLFLEELRRAGVPASISGGRRFFAREEIQTLQALIDALLDPDHPLALFSALRSPALGLSDDELVRRFAPLADAPDVDRATREAEDRLRALAADARTLPVPETLERLAEELALLPVFGFRPDGAARVEAIRLLIEAADSLAEAGYDSLPAFARWLREQEVERPGPGDDEPGDLDGISILTMHKAKGLEFPVVVLADLAGGVPTHLEVVPDRARGRLEFSLAGAEVETPGFAEAARIERKRQAAEEVRLLYVAMTRARERLVLCWPEARSGHLRPDGLPARLGAAPGQPAPDGNPLSTLRAAGWPVLPTSGRVHRVDPAAATAAPTPPDDWPAERERGLGDRPVLVATDAVERGPADSRSPAADRDLGAAGAARAAGEGERPPTPALDSEQDSISFSTKDLGVLVHAALEFWRPGSGRVATEAEAAVRAAIARHPELAPRAGEVADLLGRVFLDPALEPLRAALTGRRGRARREVPFLLPEGDQVLSGTLDVLLEEPDGTLVVIDWKTGRPPMAAATAQAGAYARAVERLTGRVPRETRFLLLGSDPVGTVSIPGRGAPLPAEPEF